MNAKAPKEIRHVVVIGAGVIGLSTAWFLQEQGIGVTVVERDHVGAGASHGNAGWIIPGRAAPLNEPSALTEGLKGLVATHGPVSVSARCGPATLLFLARFARHCTPGRRNRARRGLLGLNAASAAAYDRLIAAGLDVPVIDAPIVAAFSSPGRIGHLPPGDDLAALPLGEARSLAPQLGPRVRAAVRIRDARYVEPALLVRGLAKAVVDRGGTIRTGRTVTRVRPGAGVDTDDGTIDGDAVVIATGAALSTLAKEHGVRVPVAAGRGYSFTVRLNRPAPGPIYLPEQRLACTPVPGGLRIAGMMEFARPGAQADRRRFDRIGRAAASMLSGADWSDRTDEWAGDRPLTPDGLPLVGPTRTPGVWVAGGHGMWGVTQGAATGALLADHLATGVTPDALRPLDPRR